MMLARAILLMSMLLAAAVANAAERGFYFGLMGGQAEYEFAPSPFFPIVSAAPDPVLRIPPISEPFPAPIGGVAAFAVASPISWPQSADDEATAWGALVGYRIFRYMAVEASYLDLGTLKRTERIGLGFPSLLGFIDTQHELTTSGPAASALGILPIGDSVEFYVRGGVMFADSELDTHIVNASAPVIDRSSPITFGSEAVLWGAGAQFNWGEHWSLRLDFQRFESVGEDNGFGEADIDLLSLGVLFRL